MKTILRSLFATLFVVLAACYIAGYGLLFFWNSGAAAWHQVEPWVGPQPTIVDFEQNEFGQYWLLKADAAWVQRAAQDLHAAPYTLDHVIDGREDAYCQGHAVLKRYRCPLPVRLYDAEKKPQSRELRDIELWQLADGHALLMWEGAHLHDFFKELPSVSYSESGGEEALELIRGGGVVNLQGEPVLPEQAPTLETACVMLPYPQTEEHKPILIPTEALFAAYPTAKEVWWESPWLLLPYFAALLLAPALLADGAWLWLRRRMPQGVGEYAAWLLLPPLFALPFFVMALMQLADAPFGPILAMVVTALYAGLQMFLSALLIPCGMLFCHLVRRTAA